MICFIYAAQRGVYLFPSFFEYLRMRNFSVFSIGSHCFLKSSIILLEYNTYWLQLSGSSNGQYLTM